MNKKISVIASLMALAGVAYWGVLKYEGNAWEKAVLALPIGIEKDYQGQVSLQIKDVVREFSGRTFNASLNIQSPGGNIVIVWKGRTDFGLGMVTTLTLEQTQGLGAELLRSGIQGWNDRLVLRRSLFSKDDEITYDVEPFLWRASNGEGCDSQAIHMRTTSNNQEVRSNTQWGGLVCRTQDQKSLVFDLKGVSIESHARVSGTMGLDGRITFNVQNLLIPSLLSLNDLTGVQTIAPHKKSSVQTAGTGVLDTISEAMDVRLSYAAKDIVYGDAEAKEQLDGAAVDISIENLTPQVAGAISSFSSAFAIGANPFVALGVIQNAFINNGLAFNVHELSVTKHQSKALIAGRFAYRADVQPVTIGALSVTVPEVVVRNTPFDDELKDFVRMGTLKASEGVYTSHIVFEPNRILANGIVVQDGL